MSHRTTIRPEVPPPLCHVPPGLPDPFHPACFICGTTNPSGLRLDFTVDSNGTASAIWHPSIVFQSYPDRVHGGILAALADGAMVHAMWASGHAAVTAELTVRYLHPANLCHPLAISGRVESGRHGLYHCVATIDQEGSPVVRALAKFMPGRAAACRLRVG